MPSKEAAITEFRPPPGRGRGRGIRSPTSPHSEALKHLEITEST